MLDLQGKVPFPRDLAALAITQAKSEDQVRQVQGQLQVKRPQVQRQQAQRPQVQQLQAQ